MSEQSQPWHLPVMPEEVISWWHHKEGGIYIDGTVGGGGHSRLLLEKDPTARLLGIDRDPESIEKSRENLAEFGERVSLHLGSYADIQDILEAEGLSSVDGILLDLGVNSHQLDDGRRGFSLQREGPLDMRFNQEDPSMQTAADIVNHSSFDELVLILRKWGEEPQAKKIARAILAYREEQPFETTEELSLLINRKVFTKRKINPATLTFQALRMEVNRELDHVETFFERCLSTLSVGGRIAILSFHSLEDRMTKHTFRDWANDCICSKRIPICQCDKQQEVNILTRKPIRAKDREVRENPRSRSALLRVCEKIDR